MIRVFVSGKYTDDTKEKIQAHVEKAKQAGITLMKLGYYPYVPHTMYGFWDEEHPELTWDVVMMNTVAWLCQSDCILMLPSSEWSKGAEIELNEAVCLNIPIFHSIEKIKQHYGINRERIMLNA